MIEEKELLLGKLQPEIIQWGPLDKLIRRDEELQHVVDEGSNIEKFVKTEEEYAQNELTKLDMLEETMTEEDKITHNMEPKRQGLSALLQDVSEFN